MAALWEEIHGFRSPGEFFRFESWIDSQVEEGGAVKIAASSQYLGAPVFAESWYQNRESGEVWRLVRPDFPFTGLFEPLEKQSIIDPAGTRST
jgi:hypothetical protein